MELFMPLTKYHLSRQIIEVKPTQMKRTMEIIRLLKQNQILYHFSTSPHYFLAFNLLSVEMMTGQFPNHRI